MPRFQYRYTALVTRDPDKIQAHLVEWAPAGWEVVSHSTTIAGPTFTWRKSI